MLELIFSLCLLCMCVKHLSWLRFRMNVEQKGHKDEIIMHCMLSSTGMRFRS